MSLCERGTHQVHDFTFRPVRVGEQAMVGPLLRRLGPGMLLGDRNFFSHDLINSVLATGCDLLARVEASQRVFRRDKVLPDGSSLSKVYPSTTDKRNDRNGVVVRIIESTHDDPNLIL